MTIAALVYTPHRDDAPDQNHPGVAACAFIEMKAAIGQAAKFHRMLMPERVSLNEEA
jgi:hypothetical protein